MHRLLTHLEQLGFTGAPGVVGIDGDFEVLTFIEGDVAVPPYPTWAADDDLLVSVARLQRRYHEAVAGFLPPRDAAWRNGPAPASFSGDLVCHNDICLKNVVVRDGRAIGLIDFDLAGPVDRLWDIAVAMRHWVPLRNPIDMHDGQADVDVFGRFRRFADAHDLDREQRSSVLDALAEFLDSALVHIREQAEAGHTGHAAQWNAGYEASNRRARQWIGDQRDTLLSA